jgi:membrane associated rhomboid family serine protease
MFTLYFMGSYVEGYFSIILGKPLLYVALYLAGIAVASLPSYLKNRNNPHYRSLGASGGVAAVLFASVYFSPFGMIYVFFIKMPNILFAILYLAYTIYMSRKGTDNINHDAHLWGAIFGFVFTLAVSPDHGQLFLQQLQNWRF